MTNLSEAAARQLAELDKEVAYWYKIAATSGPLEARELARGIEIAVGRMRKAIEEATVRADDDEPITEEWLLSVGWSRGGLVLWFADYITWSARRGLYVGFYEQPHIKTRGQLRRLCEALGVEVKDA